MAIFYRWVWIAPLSCALPDTPLIPTPRDNLSLDFPGVFSSCISSEGNGKNGHSNLLYDSKQGFESAACGALFLLRPDLSSDCCGLHRFCPNLLPGWDVHSETAKPTGSCPCGVVYQLGHSPRGTGATDLAGKDAVAYAPGSCGGGRGSPDGYFWFRYAGSSDLIPTASSSVFGR
jgi:hypothetical protein